MDIEKLKYPIGKFEKPTDFTDSSRIGFIADIESFPTKLKNTVIDLKDVQLDSEYRPEGWTIRQLINHCSDSHMNGFIRFKLALTEEKPVIKPYLEKLWAETDDYKSVPINFALSILEGVHSRWTILLNSMKNDQFNKIYIHPEMNREIRLNEALALYSWHSNHHLKHIVNAIERNNW